MKWTRPHKNFLKPFTLKKALFAVLIAALFGHIIFYSPVNVVLGDTTNRLRLICHTTTKLDSEGESNNSTEQDDLCDWDYATAIKDKLSFLQLGPSGGIGTVFVTNHRMPGNMSFGGRNGMAAADLVCDYEANIAGLEGKYIAWLSNSGTNARDRFPAAYKDFDYKLANGVSIGTINQIAANSRPATLINLNASGQTPSGNGTAVWTGTNNNGTKRVQNGTSDCNRGDNEECFSDEDVSFCGNWNEGKPNDDSYRATPGAMNNLSRWSSTGSTSQCNSDNNNSDYRLYCFKTEGTQTQFKKIFVTERRYNGNLGGLDGADAKCQAEATENNISGTYKAWLADTTGSPNTRMNRHNGPYRDLNNTILAENYSDLTDGTVFRNLEVKADKTIITSSFERVWTGTNNEGNLYGAQRHCTNWTSSTSTVNGRVGEPLDRTQWANERDFTCDRTAYLYCLEQ